MQNSNDRPGVSAEDDPLFDADHSHSPSTAARRASLTVADIEGHRTTWAAIAADRLANGTHPHRTN
ncbi:hypothetical protein [Streptomyces sp. DSM 41033]|uniref:hypothetical protein n=1 Tax=Streptomyces sp. DSM 41033 TaxID=3448655 RepID=UPI00404012BA